MALVRYLACGGTNNNNNGGGGGGEGGADGGSEGLDRERRQQLTVVGSVFVRFADPDAEAEWWAKTRPGAASRTPGRIFLLVALCLARLAADLAACCAIDENDDGDSGRWTTALATLDAVVQVSATAADVAATTWPSEYRDRLLAALRCGCLPSGILLRASRLAILLPRQRGPDVSNASSRSAATSGVAFAALFGHVAAALDAFRFPLRFRHHVLVQSGIAAITAGWNWLACWKAGGRFAFRRAAYDTCAWLGMVTTGVYVDCERAGPQAACWCGASQANVLASLVLTSALVYRREMASRARFALKRR